MTSSYIRQAVIYTNSGTTFRCIDMPADSGEVYAKVTIIIWYYKPLMMVNLKITNRITPLTSRFGWLVYIAVTWASMSLKSPATCLFFHGQTIGQYQSSTLLYPFRRKIHRWRVDSSHNDYSLPWRHNGRDSVSNHQPHDCLLNRLFRRRSKKTSKLRVTGLSAGNSPWTSEVPAQMASNAENVSIWWRHCVMRR